MTTSVYAGKCSTGGPAHYVKGDFMRFMLGTLLLFISFVAPTNGATRQDLDAKIQELKQAVNTEIIQGVDVLNALSVLTAPAQSLTTGIVQGLMGTTINLPVYWKEGTRPVSGLQFDLVMGSGLTPVSVTPGIAALASGKSTTGNIVANSYRVIVFGLNQTPIPSGPVGIVRVSIGSAAGLGKRNISITNLTASDPDGISVPITGKAGSVTIQ